MGFCESQTHLHSIQIWTQNPSEDLKIREYKQRHGEARIKVRWSNRDSLVHASRRDHKRPFDYLP